MTGNDVVAKASRIFQGLDSTVAADYYGMALNWLVSKVRIFPEEAEDISLVAGTKLYTLDPLVARVWSAAYVTGPSTFQELRPTNIDWLDQRESGWRWLTPGVPDRFYEIGGQVGFHATPNQSTAGTYPFVRLYTSKRQTLALSDPLPGFLDDPSALAYRICYLAASEIEPGREDEFRVKTRNSLEELKVDVFGRLPRESPSAHFDVPSIRY